MACLKTLPISIARGPAAAAVPSCPPVLLQVDGLAKPTAARVMSLARGGQILLTPEARAALGETALKLQSHGHWMMKGLADPVELFEDEPY